jgi:hypothetical protein
MVRAAHAVPTLARGVCAGKVVGEGSTAEMEDRAEYRETIGQAIERGISLVSPLLSFSTCTDEPRAQCRAAWFRGNATCVGAVLMKDRSSSRFLTADGGVAATTLSRHQLRADIEHSHEAHGRRSAIPMRHQHEHRSSTTPGNGSKHAHGVVNQ